MRTPQGDRIYNVLRNHQGRENAISAPAICRKLRWREGREREVRRIIRDESPLWAENDGLVCAAPGGGYFLGQTFEELVAYHTWLTEGRKSYDERIASVENYCHARGLNLHRSRAAA